MCGISTLEETHSLNFDFAPEHLPKPTDSERVALGMERWRVATERVGGELSAFAADYATDPRKRPLLESVFGNSPFLSHGLVLEAKFFRQLMERGAERTLESLLASLPHGRHEAHAQAPSPEETMRGLRIAKRRAALLIALADIAGVWDLERVTPALARIREAGLIDPQAGADLIEATRLWRRLQGMIRLTAGEPFREEEAPAGLRKALAEAGRVPSFEGLKAHMREMADRVRGLYEAIIDEPSAR